MAEKGVAGKNTIKERFNELAKQVTIDTSGFVTALLKKKEVSEALIVSNLMFTIRSRDRIANSARRNKVKLKSTRFRSKTVLHCQTLSKLEQQSKHHLVSKSKILMKALQPLPRRSRMSKLTKATQRTCLIQSIGSIYDERGCLGHTQAGSA